MHGRTSQRTDTYQLKVTLRGSHPAIWRQFQVRSDITLAKLHNTLQIVMGWTNTHLHRFLIRGKQYGIPDEGDMVLRKMIDGRKHRLSDVVKGQAPRFTYEYDFGDGWQHELLVENSLSPEAGVVSDLSYGRARLSARRRRRNGRIREPAGGAPKPSPSATRGISGMDRGRFRPRGVRCKRSQSQTPPPEVVK